MTIKVQTKAEKEQDCQSMPMQVGAINFGPEHDEQGRNGVYDPQRPLEVDWSAFQGEVTPTAPLSTYEYVPFKGDLPEPAVDMVNHPPHYMEHPSGVECITITEHMSFNVGNAVKYLWRADHKSDAIEDMKKAVWYIQREIERRKRGGKC